jgi:hypothetical protein
MNQSEFEADLQRQGYQVFYGGLQAGVVNPDHTHDWDARVMVIHGQITLTRGGKAETFRAVSQLHGEGTTPPRMRARGMTKLPGRGPAHDRQIASS